MRAKAHYKFIAMILLTALLCVSLTGCGGKPAETEKETETRTDVSPSEEVSTTPSPEPEPEPEPVELLAVDADLSGAPGAALETDDLPNIGNWTEGAVAWNEVTITADGVYSISMNYSLASTSAWISGTISLRPAGSDDAKELGFRVRSTDSSWDDENWSIYEDSGKMNMYLEAGTYTVAILSDKLSDREVRYESPVSHYINLRSVSIIPNGDIDPEGGRLYSLADYDGWWYQLEENTNTYKGRVLYIDASKGTYAASDKYGNKSQTLGVEYNSENGKLYLEDEYWDPTELYFGEDGNTDVLWYDNWDEDKVEPVYQRGEPLTAPAVSLEGIPGNWYRYGITEGDAVEYIAFSEDGTYRFFNDNVLELVEGRSGTYSLAERAGEYYRGHEFDYLSLSMSTDDAYISDDRLVIGITYYHEDKFNAQGEPAYAGMHYYIHESNIDTPEAQDAIQRFNIFNFNWEDKDQNSLRFSRDGQVHYYTYIEDYGYNAEKAGVWTYEDGVLTITWNGVFIDYELQEVDSAVVDECIVDDVEDGFTLPSLGRFSDVGY